MQDFECGWEYWAEFSGFFLNDFTMGWDDGVHCLSFSFPFLLFPFSGLLRLVGGAGIGYSHTYVQT
jgi:hypothetical protein